MSEGSPAAAGEPLLLPRLCSLDKGPNGFGFHLHGEKNKSGQFIRLVEADSPAEHAGLRAGDRLVEVNGENVEGASHQQVVNRIREADGGVRLLVVDRETDERLQKLGLPCREELIHGLPGSGDGQRRKDEAIPEEEKELRPRLCSMKKGPNGYGFNLHSEKNKPGQYIRAVDPDSPAEASGLKPQDRIIEVNKKCMEGKQHAEVVAAIKTSGDETSLLVVDPEADEFFKKCKVIPSQAHLTGPLPEPVVNGDVEEKNNGKEELSELVAESPPSTPELVTAPSTPNDPDEKFNSQEQLEKGDSTPNPALDLNVPLAVAKERAHQKRSNKKAPPMDWSKKNELFSNL
ncbi:Na(+)/H(+) exchange regulatory cofactor NHE-RF1 isoform X2 [Rhinatrema bivittatum]|uniref:Na(+)/H(+) exchange regulatory cofactor NHE-RF1 isoform X2 n=1 Tax=Rhinatrema bivittatum TaxID=194408 RepID=UPI00112E6FFC|nr:Na(+)/H(+) exchange regulatory cofactor NHE-RF1 isoform X2 [Rhinatrema bivittatum]